MKNYGRNISPEIVEKIHMETMRILETVGVRMENEEALSIFKAHGIKCEDNTIFLTQKNIEKATMTAPENFKLHSSKGDLEIGNGSRITMPAASSIYMEDNGKIRRMNNADVVNLFKLSTTSEEIGYGFMNYLPEDKHFSDQSKIFSHVSMQLKYGHQPGHACPNTFKVDPEAVQSISKESIQLIKRFEGVEDKYINIMGINSLSPLCFDRMPIDKLIAYSEENQPIWIAPCGMPAMTTPPSLLSTMAVTNAEVLCGLVLTQLIHPGVPFIYGNTSAATNLRTIQLSIGAPETALMVYATVAIADYYGLPCRTGGGLSDAKDVDYQAGAETMMLLQATFDAGADISLHACGVMGSFNVISLEKFVLDEESISFSRRIIEGFDISPDKECYEIIKKAGPRGSFLKGRTPKIYREEFIMPKIFNKQDPNEWQKQGSLSIKKSAQAVVEKRIKSYQPPKLTKDQEKLLLPYLPEDYQIMI